MGKSRKKTRKYHFVNMLFHLPTGEWLKFTGLVSGYMTKKGKLVVDPDKIFQAAFGRKLPGNSIIHHG